MSEEKRHSMEINSLIGTLSHIMKSTDDADIRKLAKEKLKKVLEEI